MARKNIYVVVALFAIAAVTASQEPKHPPNHHGDEHSGNSHHGENNHDHSHHIISAISVEISSKVSLDDPALKNSLTAQEETLEENLAQDALVGEDNNEDARKMSTPKSMQEEPEVPEETEDDGLKMKPLVFWTNCDYKIIPRIRCHDCRTRLICKNPGQGKLLSCVSSLKPYCNNGYCSSISSAGCS